MVDQKFIIDNISNDSKTLVELFINNYAENSQTTYINAIRRLQGERMNRYESKITNNSGITVAAWCPCKGSCSLTCSGSCKGGCGGGCKGYCLNGNSNFW